MSGYTKLFSSILASTIWREDDKTRIVWITLLAMADKNGIAEGSVPGLADFARVSVEDCRAAIGKLSSPDIDSRTPDFDGRRIKAVDGGWQLLNHAKYRAKLNADERREYLRQKQAEFRAKKKPETSCQQVSTMVNNGQQVSTLSTHAEAKAQAKAEALLSIESPSGDSQPVPRGFAPTETQLKINAMFGRRNSTAWTDAENRALRKIQIDNDDLRILGLYYGADIATDKDIRRRDIKTLLNNWPGEVDRARTFLAANPSVDPTAPRVTREF